MGRKKVALEFISNDYTRKTTFNKRKKGFFKKVSELSTLCDLDACAIIYSPYNPQVEVWPSPIGAQRVIERLKHMPEIEQSKKMLSHNSFLQERIKKAEEKLKKQRESNHEQELINVMYEGLRGYEFFKYMKISDISELGLVIDQKLRELNLRIWSLEQQQLLDKQVGVNAPPSQVAIMATPIVEATPSGALSAEVVTTPYTLYNPSMDVMLGFRGIEKW